MTIKEVVTRLDSMQYADIEKGREFLRLFFEILPDDVLADLYFIYNDKFWETETAQTQIRNICDIFENGKLNGDELENTLIEELDTNKNYYMRVINIDTPDIITTDIKKYFPFDRIIEFFLDVMRGYDDLAN